MLNTKRNPHYFHWPSEILARKMASNCSIPRSRSFCKKQQHYHNNNTFDVCKCTALKKSTQYCNNTHLIVKTNNVRNAKCRVLAKSEKKRHEQSNKVIDARKRWKSHSVNKKKFLVYTSFRDDRTQWNAARTLTAAAVKGANTVN